MSGLAHGVCQRSCEPARPHSWIPTGIRRAAATRGDRDVAFSRTDRSVASLVGIPARSDLASSPSSGALRVSSPGDAAEREADWAADRVSRGEPVRLGAKPAAPLARKCAACTEAENGPEAGATRAVADVLSAPGRSLADSDRAYFETRFGADFSGVRVHADSDSDSAARALDARAFTRGRSIAFAAGEYAPDTPAGRHLLAHELAHVVQGQGDPSGEVRRAPAGPGAAEATPAAKVATAANVQDCQGNDAREVLAALRIAPGAARMAAAAIMTRPLSPAVAAVLTRIFGPNAQQQTTAIALRLHLIASGLPNVTCECENPGSVAYDFFCENAVAYVRAVPAFFGMGNIHICQPQFRNMSQRDQVATIVHEGAHRFINADDEAYYAAGCADTAETLALSDADRMDNADCYACLMQGIVSP